MAGHAFPDRYSELRIDVRPPYSVPEAAIAQGLQLHIHCTCVTDNKEGVP
jgi:hypothetical protein